VSTVVTQHGETRLESLLVTSGDALRPLVLIFPTVMNRAALEQGFAERLVELGYAALICDLYGDGRIGLPREECFPLMQSLHADRALLKGRLLALLDTARALPQADPARIAAIGFCFGGLCALDLARSGADLAGVASFHGLFDPPPEPTAGPIVAKIIAYHGWDDPLAPPDTVTALAAELTARDADWQLHAYGGTVHGFMNPASAAPGIRHNPRAARRAWAALEDFLDECFGGV
jgi:dienelactone hydrolase